MKDIIEDVTLVQLIDTKRNFNHDINIVGYWIIDSNYEKSFHLTRKSLELICSSSVGELQVVKFETVFYAVRYLCLPGNLTIV